MKEQLKMDRTDAIILKILLNDARASFTKIAKVCNVQANVIRTRYNRLKKEGIITGEIIEIQPEVFGYKCRATLRVSVNANKIADVVDQLKKMPHILRIAEGLGRKNLLCFTIAKDVTDLDKILERVRGQKGVATVEADLWVATEREAFPENLQINFEE